MSAKNTPAKTPTPENELPHGGESGPLSCSAFDEWWKNQKNLNEAQKVAAKEGWDTALLCASATFEFHLKKEERMSQDAYEIHGAISGLFSWS